MAVRSIVLLYDTKRKKDISRKLSFKWLRLYKIFDTVKNKGTYILEELDRLRLAVIFAGDRLKRFHSQQKLYLDHALDHDLEERSILGDILTGNKEN